MVGPKAYIHSSRLKKNISQTRKEAVMIEKMKILNRNKGQPSEGTLAISAYLGYRRGGLSTDLVSVAILDLESAPMK